MCVYYANAKRWYNKYLEILNISPLHPSKNKTKQNKTKQKQHLGLFNLFNIVELFKQDIFL